MGAIQMDCCRRAVVKPAGGYRLIPVTRLFAAWWHYKSGNLKFRDLRTYFALEEMVARRCVMRRGRAAQYTLAELGNLTGVKGTKQISASVSRLERSGLSTWNVDQIVFDETSYLNREEGFTERLACIANHRRRVPVPRRTLRWLARATRPALVATVLGHLFRCLYAKGGYISAEGCISARWVAAVFGVDARNVKRAKSQLRALNWLSVKQSNHWHRQRYGGTVTVNLDWMPGDGCSGRRRASKLPPHSSVADTSLPPPDSNKELPKEIKNQKPATPGRAGIQKNRLRTPRLGNVQADDLRDVGQVLVLFEHASKQGLIGSSESDRLRFVSAAVRASTKATRNPGGFFRRLLRDKLWHHVTIADETQANLLLKQHLFEVPVKQSAPPQARHRAERAIADIRFIAHVTASLKAHGYAGDPFELVAKQDSRWTRDRWNLAMRGWLTPNSRNDDPPDSVPRPL